MVQKEALQLDKRTCIGFQNSQTELLKVYNTETNFAESHYQVM
jgi:hypothetical protein